MTDRLLTIEEAAERLRCSTCTVRRMIRRGELAVYPSPGRRKYVVEATVDAWIDRHTMWPTPPTSRPLPPAPASRRLRSSGARRLVDVPDVLSDPS